MAPLEEDPGSPLMILKNDLKKALYNNLKASKMIRKPKMKIQSRVRLQDLLCSRTKIFQHQQQKLQQVRTQGSPSKRL